MAEYTIEEQAEHRAQWVVALRSGKYKQSMGKLRVADAFCCLGVACDISGLGEWTLHNYYLGQSMALPFEVFTWLGLRTSEGDRERGNSLAGMNDQDGKSFNDIADVIESEPEGLVIGGEYDSK